MRNISEKTLLAVKAAEAELAAVFAKFDGTAKTVAEKILTAFYDNRVSEAHLHGTTGYGYDDRGRDTLERIYAQVMGCEAALVRSSIVSGTHALAIGLFGLLRPGDTLLSVTGKPYDTLDEVIGIEGEAGNGSLSDFRVRYEQTDMKNGFIDYEKVEKRLHKGGVKVVFVQRSKGYAADRRTLPVEEIGRLADIVHGFDNVYLVVDNCYGEFVQTSEPVASGADLQIGSLIKNPGGGLCRTGGYLAGTKKAVELCS
ncbi:MAG: methionine gamma-lyase family protein, partial [Clostridia bacterium]|nr:methionine gamma-lyase family protein [Clostridia bacterium]